MAKRKALALAALVVAIAGCGGSGLSADATVSVYVAAPLCKEAREVLKRAGGEAGDLKVRGICLPPIRSGGRVDLAVAGADARRTTEDSTSVAYLEFSGPGAEFTRSILESADIAEVEAESGAAAMRQVLAALEGRGSSSPRRAVSDEVA